MIAPAAIAPPGRRRRCVTGRARAALGIALAALLLAPCGRSPSPSLHLLLVTVDTLRADRLGCYGNRLELTPNLDRLAQSSVLFATAFASAPSTLATMTAIMVGEHPETIGVRNNAARVPDGIVTLAGRLSERGWRTGAIVSNPVLAEKCGLDAGFSEYDATLPPAQTSRDLPERTAAATTDGALAMIDRLLGAGDAPIFLWVHYQDPHGPYQPPAGYRERYLQAERQAPDGGRALAESGSLRGIGGIPSYQLIADHRDAAYYRAGYDGEIRYADEQIGRLLDGWSERGLDERSLVAFTSDHGEGMGENDYWFAHGEFLSDELLRVPLMIRLPGLAAARRTDLVSLVDLLPTLCGALDVAAGDVAGRDLLEPGARNRAGVAYFMTMPAESSVPRIGIAKDGYKYVLTMEGGALSDTLMRLQDESRSVAPPSRELVGDLRTTMLAIRRQIPAGMVSPGPPLTERERERLRALGYVTGDDVGDTAREP